MHCVPDRPGVLMSIAPPRAVEPILSVLALICGCTAIAILILTSQVYLGAALGGVFATLSLLLGAIKIRRIRSSETSGPHIRKLKD